MGNSGVKEGSDRIEFIANATANKHSKARSKRRLQDDKATDAPKREDVEVTIIWTEGGSNVLLAADFFDHWTRYETMERYGNVFKITVVG